MVAVNSNDQFHHYQLLTVSPEVNFARPVVEQGCLHSRILRHVQTTTRHGSVIPRCPQLLPCAGTFQSKRKSMSQANKKIERNCDSEAMEKPLQEATCMGAKSTTIPSLPDRRAAQRVCRDLRKQSMARSGPPNSSHVSVNFNFNFGPTILNLPNRHQSMSGPRSHLLRRLSH